MATTIIANLQDLLDWAGADTPRTLNRRLYKDTSCGASISLQLESGPTCASCAEYFARFSCGANVGQGECDCPRCTGLCGCERLRWLHNGSSRLESLPNDTPITSFTIQTIIEGSEATVDSEPFYLPVSYAVVDAWIKEMEAAAIRLWHEANGDEGSDEDDEQGDTH